MHPKAAAGTTVASEHDIRIIRTVRPDLPRWHPRRGSQTIAAVTKAVHQTIGNENWDVVHIHTPYTGAGAMAALGKKPRYIYTMHSPIVLEQQINWKAEGPLGRFKMLFGLPRLKRLEGNLMRQCSHIHTLSEFSRNWVEHFHALGNRVSVIPYWRRPEFTRTMSRASAKAALGWPTDQFTLFTLRRHSTRYGLEDAVRAIAPLAAQCRCRFVVAGDGELREHLRQLARDFGVADRVTFPGKLAESDLNLYYQASDAFILPTRALECFGLISIEALSFGCPVIATNVGAIPEVIAPILPDCLVPPGDVLALRAKVDDFCAGAEIAARGRAGGLRPKALRQEYNRAALHGTFGFVRWAAHRMRIVHIINGLSAAIGGPPNALAALAEAQARRGDEVLVLSSRRSPAPSTLPIGINGRLTVQEVNTRSENRWFNVHVMREVERLIRDCDIVHIHGGWHYHVLAAAKVCRRRDIPYIVSRTGT